MIIRTIFFQNFTLKLPCSGGSRIFPRGVRQLSKLLLFFKFLSKTAWKWKNLDPGGARIPGGPPWIRQCLDLQWLTLTCQEYDIWARLRTKWSRSLVDFYGVTTPMLRFFNVIRVSPNILHVSFLKISWMTLIYNSGWRFNIYKKIDIGGY